VPFLAGGHFGDEKEILGCHLDFVILRICKM
jgi:hypothetical protein